MSRQVNVYYMECSRASARSADYRKYQKKLENKMLNYGLKNMFHVDNGKKNIETGTYGKPYLKGMEHYQYNMSNTDGMVVCAMSDIALGVDVERKKSFRKGILHKFANSKEAAYILAPDGEAQQEQRFFQLWTLKESYIKMTGEGMRIPLKEIALEISHRNGKEEQEIRCNKEGNFYQRQLGEYWISLCVPEKADVHWISIAEDFDITIAQ